MNALRYFTALLLIAAAVPRIQAQNPDLPASTYLGSTDQDWVEAMATDAAGHVYVAGRTASSDFPVTADGYDTSFNGWSDVFVAKFDADLENLLASTLLGGSLEDRPFAIAVASDGIYVGGLTRSTDFPVVSGCYDLSYEGFSDAFVAKLDFDLENLIASTFLGGGSLLNDAINGLVIAPSGDIFVGGNTASSDFPVTPGAWATSRSGFSDGFLSRFDAGLTTLKASTFIGGGDADAIFDLVLSTGGIYASGVSWSWDFPFNGQAYDSLLDGSTDALIVYLDEDLANLQGATLLGGNSFEDGLDIGLSAAGQPYVTGFTESTDFPTTPGAYQSAHNGALKNAYLARFSPALDALQASTYFGGSSGALGELLLIGPGGDLFLAGWTGSTDLPISSGAYDSTAQIVEGFLARFSPDLDMLKACTYLGGEDSESIWAIAFGEDGDLYAAGETGSLQFPVHSGAYDQTPGGMLDAFVSRLHPSLLQTATGISTLDPGGAVRFQGVIPNPFRNATILRFEVEEGAAVRLSVFDNNGRLIEVIQDAWMPAGSHRVAWPTGDLPAGLYLLRLEAGGMQISTPAVLLR